MNPNNQPSFWRSPMTWVILAIFVVGIGGIALAISAGGSDDGPPETAFAEVLGDPLPPFGDSPDPAIGMTAPTISAQTIDGDRVQIEADGTARVYGFFAHWCPVCQAELPEVVEWLEEADLGDDVEVVAISTGVDAGRDNYPPSEWFEEEGFTGTVLFDSDDSALALGFGLPAFPYWVVVDGEGNVVNRVSGALERSTFDALLASVS